MAKTVNDLVLDAALGYIKTNATTLTASSLDTYLLSYLTLGYRNLILNTKRRSLDLTAEERSFLMTAKDRSTMLEVKQ